jgi:hypothetical protein
VLCDESAADASVALALLASGVVEFHAEDVDQARKMLTARQPQKMAPASSSD